MVGIKIAHWVYTACVGVFAGLLYTFEQAVIPTLNTLTATEYTKVEQGLIQYLDAFPTGVIGISLVAMLLPLYPLIRLWRHRSTAFWRWTASGWVLFFLGVGLFTIVLNAPINAYVKTWDVASPPADWQTARDNWNQLNRIRTPINLVSLLCLLWAALCPIPGVQPPPKANDRDPADSP